MKYDVWMQGYVVSGDSQTASYLGVYEAESFEEACAKAAQAKGWSTGSGAFRPSHTGKAINRTTGEWYDVQCPPSYWGCSMFDNEADARRGFG